MTVQRSCEESARARKEEERVSGSRLLSTKPTTAMATYNPSTRPEQIDTLISGVDRYNPHNLPLLHEYLEAQLKNEHDWDCMAALAVLKL